MKILCFLGIALILSQIKPAMDAVNALSSIEYVYIRNEINTDEYNAMKTPVLADIKENIVIALIGALLVFCALI